MLTENTLKAITLLYETDGRNRMPRANEQVQFTTDERDYLLGQFRKYRFIDEENKLIRPLHNISLLELLTAIHEGVYPIPNTKEELELYSQYGHAAKLLGVVNQIMNTILKKISMADL